MNQTNYLRDATAALAAAALVGVVILSAIGSGTSWSDDVTAVLVAVVGLLALLIALVSGASKWWWLALPVLLIPILPFGLLWFACKFGGDCI